MEKKRPLGFETPSMRMQEEYGEIIEQLKKKKANWGKILKHTSDMSDNSFKDAEDFIKEIQAEKEIEEEDLAEIRFRVARAGQLVTRFFVARIGKELSECDVRIAAVEKELKELRRGLK